MNLPLPKTRPPDAFELWAQAHPIALTIAISALWIAVALGCWIRRPRIQREPPTVFPPPIDPILPKAKPLPRAIAKQRKINNKEPS